MTASAQKNPANAQVESAAPVDVIDQILAETKVAQPGDEQTQTKNSIKQLMKGVFDKTVVVSDNLSVALDARIAEIDRLISAQLSLVMHAPEFQKLESSWRGLHYLCEHTNSTSQMKIKVFNATKQELLKDFNSSGGFDQNAMFIKVYEEEFGQFGGSPFAAIIGDFQIGRGAADMEFLSHMSHVAAAAHAPFISAASPELFNLESFTGLGKPPDLSQIFDNVQYAKWKSFRESEDSRYVGLTLPRFLGRLPFNPKDGKTTEGFNFVEEVTGADHSKYLWVNAAYAFASRLTAAFEKSGWCAAIRGVEGGGLVEDLPAHTFKTDDGEVALKCPTEVTITNRREKELNDLGFIPLVHCKDTDEAAFFGASSTQKAKKYNTDEANANAHLSTQLQYMFAVSRISHYMKAIAQEKIGDYTFSTAKQAEDYLNGWINQYILSSDDASPEQKAKFPLREAKIEVAAIPGKPGSYTSVAYLRPHFQLDGLTVSLRLVADLPKE
jgi:type VI secretion system protein ImpC